MRNPNIAGRRPPNMSNLQRFNVNRAGAIETIWQPLYDFLVYPTAGQLSFTFFQRSTGTAGTTLSDTNMQAAGQIPRPQEFLVTGLQVVFFPSADAARAGLVTTIVQTNWLDTVNVAETGNLTLNIGSKAYLRDFPTGKFPPVFSVQGEGPIGDSSTAGVVNKSFIDFARASGSYYSVTPFKIPANQNFDVTVNFAALVPVTANSRLGVILDGYLYRLSQ